MKEDIIETIRRFKNKVYWIINKHIYKDYILREKYDEKTKTQTEERGQKDQD